MIVNEFKTYVYLNDTYQGEYQLLDYRITESGSLAKPFCPGYLTGMAPAAK